MTEGRARVRRDLALLGLLAVTVLVVAADVPLARPLAVLATGLLVPGAAILTRLRPATDLLVSVGVAIGLSIALEIGLATLAAVTGWWHPVLLAAILAAGAAALLAADLRTALDDTGPAATP
ncbi:MAG: hypothetical protein JWM31_116 [Solirubrobacterales bacterium]|nr:hypothetical protein [Solirubrobacterales bacterium]